MSKMMNDLDQSQRRDEAVIFFFPGKMIFGGVLGLFSFQFVGEVVKKCSYRYLHSLVRTDKLDS
jgi:hypothetical protein